MMPGFDEFFNKIFNGGHSILSHTTIQEREWHELCQETLERFGDTLYVKKTGCEYEVLEKCMEGYGLTERQFLGVLAYLKAMHIFEKNKETFESEYWKRKYMKTLNMERRR